MPELTKDIVGVIFQVFCARDDWYEQRLFPTVTLSREGAISASVVIGSLGDVDARAWWRDYNQTATQPVHVLRVVGPELRILRDLDS